MAVTIPVKYYNTYILKKLVEGDISSSYNWYVEEARIKGGYNNVQTGLAPRAFIRSDNTRQQVLGNSITYSGVLNSRTGVNESNQFPSGQDITRSVDPGRGTIQKLYAEDTNLIIFQENKVNRALIDKDAIYSQEGQPIQTASNVVIGAITPYAGEFGISKNPESFAVYGYQKYFTDVNQGAVLRLSRDGITEISNYGMYDFFRDRLNNLNNGRAIGGWDVHNKCYTLSLASTTHTTETLSFDEQINGWTSRYSYAPSGIFSVQSEFFSTYQGGIWKHYQDPSVVNRSNFYGVANDSSVTTVFNAIPSVVKSFKTINYEGEGNWALTSITTNSGDSAHSIGTYSFATSLAAMDNLLFQNKFKKKENKYFANLINISPAMDGEVIFGQSISGIKGFTATAVLTATNDPDSGTNELFSVSSNYKESSY